MLEGCFGGLTGLLWYPQDPVLRVLDQLPPFFWRLQALPSLYLHFLMYFG